MSKTLRTLCATLAAVGMMHAATGCCGPCGGCRGGSCAAPALPPAGAPVYSSTPASVTAPASYEAPVAGAPAGEINPVTARAASTKGQSLEPSDEQL